MGLFSPFRATRYNKKKVDLAQVVSPPYDVISPAEREELYRRDPHNVIRLILNHDEDPYTSAEQHLEQWKQEEILKRDEEESYYVYQQIFTIGKQEFSRDGLLGTLELHPYDDKIVVPHERTHPGPKADRLKLMEATGANLSPIFGLIEDESRYFDQTLEVIKVKAPFVDIEQTLPGGATIRHILWRSYDRHFLSRIEALLKKKQIIIADGHHRYETALEFHKRHPEIEAAGRIMCYLSNIYGEGTVILPTHRLIHGLEHFDQFTLLAKIKKKFDIEFTASREQGLQKLEQGNRNRVLLEFPDNPRFVLVSSPSSQSLPVEWLHREILIPLVGITHEEIERKERIEYPHSAVEVDAFRGEPQLVAYVPAVPPSKMMEIVHAGEFMPQKTTFFYPKLLSGLAFHEFSEQTP